MADCFSRTYVEARQKFLSLSSGSDAEIASVVHPTERGAQGEDLAIDVATFGDPAASKALFLVSGTHGQEGFLGSALQIGFLRDLEIPDDVKIVALHALNPWGFSHLSRTDEHNIDINRNFTDFDASPEHDELYPILFRALCPDDWTEETVDWSGVLDEFAQRHGYQRLVTVIAGGQMVEPTGLNYTGTGPSWSRRVVSDVLPRVFAGTEKIAFIEWHTGLGPHGQLSCISSMEPGSPGHTRSFEWMGEAARSPFEDADDVSRGETPTYRGLFSAWLPSTAPAASWAGLLIEVGTYSNLVVQDAVRIDRWLRFGRGVTTTPRDEMRATMIDGLYPSSPSWRAAAMANGLDVQMRALRNLQSW